MFGVRTENMMENGKIIKCMDKEQLSGLMAESTKDNMSTTRSMESELSTGQMEGNIMVPGKMANSMAEESTS